MRHWELFLGVLCCANQEVNEYCIGALLLGSSDVRKRERDAFAALGWCGVRRRSRAFEQSTTALIFGAMELGRGIMSVLAARRFCGLLR